MDDQMIATDPRERTWNTPMDECWYIALSANQKILAAGEEHPYITLRHAFETIVEEIGCDSAIRKVQALREAGWR